MLLISLTSVKPEATSAAGLAGSVVILAYTAPSCVPNMSQSWAKCIAVTGWFYVLATSTAVDDSFALSAEARITGPESPDASA